MKKLSPLLLACALAIPSFADEPAKPALASAAAKDTTAATAIPVSTATLTAPLVLKDGAISQPEKTELPAGGKAVITFKVPKDGNYVIHAMVNAPDEDSNSFYLNIDAPPEDPLMIWDMDVTKGFEDRVVSWRGGGDSGADEFVPKVFKLTAGEHKLIIMGREPTFLKSVSVQPSTK